jgi:N-acetylmuramoyl-L-alanine amidase
VNTDAQGTSIHWWKAEDYEFAQSLEHVLGSTVGLGQKGLIRDRFVVLRATRMPAVLVETAFLTNSYEGAKLSDPAFQKVIAQQLAGGLASYMQGRYASRGQGRPAE